MAQHMAPQQSSVALAALELRTTDIQDISILPG
jgi:hypothetical protein